MSSGASAIAARPWRSASSQSPRAKASSASTMRAFERVGILLDQPQILAVGFGDLAALELGIGVEHPGLLVEAVVLEDVAKLDQGAVLIALGHVGKRRLVIVLGLLLGALAAGERQHGDQQQRRQQQGQQPRQRPRSSSRASGRAGRNCGDTNVMAKILASPGPGHTGKLPSRTKRQVCEGSGRFGSLCLGLSARCPAAPPARWRGATAGRCRSTAGHRSRGRNSPARRRCSGCGRRPARGR